MPPLENTRHERFAQERAKGETIDEAYQTAGFSANRSNASRLNSNEHIQARIAELQDRVAEKVVTTAADIVKQLKEDRDFARELKQPAAAISASMGQAKVLGLIVDRQITAEVDLKTLSEEDLERELAQLRRAGNPDFAGTTPTRGTC